MNEKKTFVVLLPHVSNVELIKDVGQIPYILSRDYNYKAKYVSCNVEPNGENVEMVEGLEIEKIPLIMGNYSISGLMYLLKNSKKIDLLNLYHAGRESYIWAKVFKFLNPKGKVYLKLDLDFNSCDMYDNDAKERDLFTANTKVMDLITVESEAVLNRIQKYAECEIELIPNGYCELEEKIEVTDKRENTFITAGRLGTKQKATEVLLEAFAKTAHQHDWNLRLIGTIDPNFEAIKNKFFEEHTELTDRIIFMGPIYNRESLYREYSKAKVFVLPSRWEGFPLVVSEALSCGCRTIVSNKVPPQYEATNYEKYGKIVLADDIEAWSMALLSATQENYSEALSLEISKYAKNKFSWTNICKKLEQYIQKI